MQEIIGDFCHDQLIANSKQALAFNAMKDYAAWKGEVKDKLIELLGIREIEKNACTLKMTIEKDQMKDGYRQIRFVFESEKGAFVPCYLLIPDTGKEKYPVVITLQGHSSGFHNSIGEIKFERDINYQPRGAFAVQAVKRGYIALAIEQRAMGERVTSRHDFHPVLGCTHATLAAFALGRTTIGERVWDAQRAIDLLSEFPQADTEKIAVTGNSGGGTASYYIGCLDERVKLIVPSCSFCSYEQSILRTHHCPCNYIPGIYNWFEMQDLACLIAPRRLALIAGKEDGSFPIEGVRAGFDVVQKIYAKENATDNCCLVETPKAHWWCENIVWDTIKEEMIKLGWNKSL